MFQKAIDTMTDWLSKQQTQTVVLMLNLAVLWGFIWWAIDRGVPQHIEMIQKGYDRQEVAHEKQLNRVIDLLLGKPGVKQASDKTVRFDVETAE